ncbi:hypothetical protein DPMN_033863 [Dreissena polymorpha]|uniref:Uncharacterized protein n=1 Tax=Dreissena polymorpha TaxID=45954 RepID=A0A9D4RKA6_DREPO|nr:hypothetical protein DPMN_175466 [Dreissena polymorpha]KAH3870673.1 hypothetical protein DPMN_033863 [Dreissena polymorpha]
MKLNVVPSEPPQVMHGHFPRLSARIMIYSLQLLWMMELRHVTAFGTTTHPPQPHHPVKPEQV